MLLQRTEGALWAIDRELVLTYAAGLPLGAPERDGGDWVGRTVYDWIGTREPTSPLLAHHLAALAGESQSFVHEHGGRAYEVLIEPLRDDTGTLAGCIGGAHDVTESRAAQERLARTEARLAEAQRIAHVGSFEWDIAPNAVTWTDELRRIYGLAEGQLAGTFEAFLAHVDRADLEHTRSALFEAFRQKGAFVFDYRIVRPDGSVRLLHARGEVVTDSFGRPVRVVGTCWDVTELTDATRARERSLSLLEATIEATADGILVIDRAGKVMLINQRLLTLWGLTRDDGDSEEALLDAMLPQVEDPDGFRAAVLDLQARPEAESVDLVRLRDGRVLERSARPQRLGGNVVGRVWTFRDISERERLLRQALFLADASRLLATLDVERALDALAHLAVPFLGDGCAIDLFGDGPPRRLLAVTRPGVEPNAAELHPSALAGHSTIYRVETTSHLAVPLIGKGGVLGVITLAASPRRRYGQNDLELAEELGRRAALAVENARLYERAEEALRARDEFLAIASHEIRGPITSLHLAVQMLRRGQVHKEDEPKAFDMIEREDRRLQRFVEELLDLSRIRRGGLHFEIEEVDLAEVVRNVCTRLASERVRSGSSLSLEIEGSVQGQWDRFRLEQVVTNLLSNAMKFGLGKPIVLALAARGGRAILSVRDQGLGIAPELQERVFRPFERGVSVRHFGGLGLGLYIVKTIAEGLGGRVGVESTPGVGSIFTVELPMVREPR